MSRTATECAQKRPEFIRIDGQSKYTRKAGYYYHCCQGEWNVGKTDQSVTAPGRKEFSNHPSNKPSRKDATVVCSFQTVSLDGRDLKYKPYLTTVEVVIHQGKILSRSRSGIPRKYPNFILSSSDTPFVLHSRACGACITVRRYSRHAFWVDALCANCSDN